MIKLFLKIDIIVLVGVSQFKIVGNIINKICGRTSNARDKNSSVFGQFYSGIKEIKDKMSFVKTSKLLSKCIDLKTSVKHLS